MASSFPRPPVPAFLEQEVGALVDDGWAPPARPAIARGCKHGVLDCEACGVTERRDALHTTQRGLGVVGRLRGRR